MPPFSLSISSTRNGTTWVSPMAASSELAKPVTDLPLTKGEPSGAFVWLKAAGPRHTAATVRPGHMHRLDQPDGLAILGQIPQGSVSARIEDRVGEERLHRLCPA